MRRKRSHGRVPWILMYHSISNSQIDPFGVTVTPEMFVRQMQWLASKNLRGIRLSDLSAAWKQGDVDGLVGLTFDDGYADFADAAVPILCRFGFTATTFVLADRLEKTNDWDAPAPQKPLMSASQLHEVVAAGMEIGSHGLTHVSMPTVTSQRLTEEVGRSRLVLSQLCDQSIDGFAYPYGHCGEREIAAAEAAGYKYAFGVGRAIPDSLHAMPRSYISQRDTEIRLAAKKIRHQLFWSRTSN